MGTTLKFLSENTVRKCTFGNASDDGIEVIGNIYENPELLK